MQGMITLWPTEEQASARARTTKSCRISMKWNVRSKRHRHPRRSSRGNETRPQAVNRPSPANSSQSPVLKCQGVFVAAHLPISKTARQSGPSFEQRFVCDTFCEAPYRRSRGQRLASLGSDRKRVSSCSPWVNLLGSILHQSFEPARFAK